MTRGWWGQDTHTQVTPALVPLEPGGQCAGAGLQPGGVGGEEETSAGVCLCVVSSQFHVAADS